jgi:hypothetical protein
VGFKGRLRRYAAKELGSTGFRLYPAGGLNRDSMVWPVSLIVLAGTGFSDTGWFVFTVFCSQLPNDSDVRNTYITVCFIKKMSV